MCGYVTFAAVAMTGPILAEDARRQVAQSVTSKCALMATRPRMLDGAPKARAGMWRSPPVTARDRSADLTAAATPGARDRAPKRPAAHKTRPRRVVRLADGARKKPLTPRLTFALVSPRREGITWLKIGSRQRSPPKSSALCKRNFRAACWSR